LLGAVSAALEEDGCKEKILNNTSEAPLRCELDSSLVCEAAEDHVFLKQRQRKSTGTLFIARMNVISPKTKALRAPLSTQKYLYSFCVDSHNTFKLHLAIKLS